MSLWSRIMNRSGQQVANAETPQPEQGKDAPPKTGALVLPRRRDHYPACMTVFKSERIQAILMSAMSGDPAELDTLITDMLIHDAHLRSVSRTRRLAVTGLPWEIITAEEAGQVPDENEDAKLAETTCDFCRQVFRKMRGLDKGLRHLAEAAGRGTAVVAPEWQLDKTGNYLIARIQPVAFTQLRSDSEEPWRLRVMLDDEDGTGVPLDEFPRGQFVVHTPELLGDSHWMGGLYVASVLGYIGKRWGWRAWLAAVEMFGQPFRIAKYPPGASEELKTEMLKMLQEMGAFGGGVWAQGSDLELVESNNKGEWPHERLCNFTDRAYSKVWLGSTLTVEIGETGGANAAAQTHNEVRQDIRDDDIANESETIREQILKPLVAVNFGPDAPVPCFRRVTEETPDIVREGNVLDIAVNKLGMKVPVSHAVAVLGVPVVEGFDDESALEGTSAGAGMLGGFSMGDVAANSRKTTRIANAGRDAKKTANVLAEWSTSATAFMARADSSIAQLIDVMATAIAELPSDASEDDVAKAIASVVPEVDIDDLENVLGALAEAGVLHGAEGNA